MIITCTIVNAGDLRTCVILCGAGSVSFLALVRSATRENRFRVSFCDFSQLTYINGPGMIKCSISMWSIVS